MITIVILNYKRPDNIIKNIIPQVSTYELVNEIIISHGNISTYFSTPEYTNIKHFYDSDKNEKSGVSLRFERAIESSNDCILFIDDDRLPSEKYVNTLYSEFIKDPLQIIAMERRYISPYGYHSYYPFIKNHKKIVLTQVMMTNKKCCYDFLEQKNKIEYITTAKNVKPVWNGEDIIFNVIFIKKYRKKPIHIYASKKNGSVINLPSPWAISSNDDHVPYRNFLSKKAYLTYNLSSVNNTNNNFWIILLIILLIILIIVLGYFSSSNILGIK
jgi:hypothetical protein